MDIFYGKYGYTFFIDRFFQLLIDLNCQAIIKATERFSGKLATEKTPC